MHRAIVTTFIAASLLLFSAGASAQWLQRLKGMLGGESTEASAAGELTDEQVAGGLREALRVGTDRVLGRLGTENGFNLDPQVHIPLPRQLEQIRGVLSRVGMDASLNELELQLNRAAEVAVPKAKTLFFDAISQMTLDDVRQIYQGPDDAATQYFRERMSAPLAAEMLPIVDDSLSQVGAARTYDEVVGRYNALPLVPPVEADLADYVVSRGIDGVFYYLAREEAAIRQDPLARTTDLLRTVFGRSAD